MEEKSGEYVIYRAVAVVVDREGSLRISRPNSSFMNSINQSLFLPGRVSSLKLPVIRTGMGISCSFFL